jgi:hypothetical protein
MSLNLNLEKPRPVCVQRLQQGPLESPTYAGKYSGSVLRSLKMVFLFANSGWLGRLDSNQGMAVPKTAALPLGYAPMHGKQAAL